MISSICETFTCTPDAALRQDFQLCQEIQGMRYFAHVHDEYKRDPKTLTKDREEYLEAMERLTA